MNLLRYKRADNYEVEEWIAENIRDLTKEQKRWISDDEIVRFSEIKFFKEVEKVSNPLIRITVFLFPIVWFLIFLTLPFNFIIRGYWGYKNLNWLTNWHSRLGL